MFAVVVLYLAGINLTTLAAFGWDKRAAARRARRIAERTLLGLAAAGGTPGAFIGSALFRHKTRKYPFRGTLWLIAGLQAAGLITAWILKN